MLPNATLLTDLYQLTMAHGYWKRGLAEREAVFHLLFRNNPFGSGFSIAAGLAPAIDYLRAFHFGSEEAGYLRTMRGRDGQPLFDPAFLEYLTTLRFTCDVDAIPEGTVVFQQEPLVRVRGPLIQAQIVESALLNLLNFQTLIATKAARVCIAAEGDVVLEFGLRRAQGVDGALAASRAAFIGGVNGTSNVLAGRQFGIPTGGTHAHSWVMAFEDEKTAFEAYAEAMPNNALFLVDTYDTLEGVRRAIEVGRKLRERGHDLIGVRLDSGDLAYLSIEARRILDEAGFPGASIVASNDLDETLIASLKQQGAKINVWGVGTRLVTGWDQPALGGVYKLGAVREPGGPWEHRIKIAEQNVKISTPGMLQVRRFEENGELAGDMIFDELLPDERGRLIIDPFDPTRRKTFSDGAQTTDLLVPVFRGGTLVYDVPPLPESRQRTHEQLGKLHPTIKRFINPHAYPVGLEHGLHELRTALILKARRVGA